jgi:hypothetical protein
MDEKEVLRYVINGFELIPAKFGFSNSYTTKTGKATKELSGIINARIKKNFPQTRIKTSFDPIYKTINFHRTMMESIGDKAAKLLVEILEARSQSVTRKVRDAIIATDPSKIRAAQNTNRIFAPDVTPEELVKKIKGLYDTEVEVIDPKSTGSKSSQFPTFPFKVDDDIVSIVLAKGIIAGAKGEDAQVTNIVQQLEGKSVTIKIGTDTYTNIDGFRKIEGNTKADFAFTSGGIDKIFIQHKSPVHQQMAGIAKAPYNEYKEVKEFTQEVRENVAKEGKLTKAYVKPIKSRQLKTLAVYGTVDATFSKNAVQGYYVGDLKLKGDGDILTLTATRSYVYPQIPTGGDTPTLVATYRADRNQAGIENVRLGIYPQSYRPVS